MSSKRAISPLLFGYFGHLGKGIFYGLVENTIVEYLQMLALAYHIGSLPGCVRGFWGKKFELYFLPVQSCIRNYYSPPVPEEDFLFEGFHYAAE